jgi:hypothetical protein
MQEMVQDRAVDQQAQMLPISRIHTGAMEVHSQRVASLVLLQEMPLPAARVMEVTDQPITMPGVVVVVVVVIMAAAVAQVQRIIVQVMPVAAAAAHPTSGE